MTFPLAALLLFVSGGAALVYQTIWVRQLTLVVGVDVYAVTAGVAAFFAGLALGSAVFGRRADRTARPAYLYAILEVGIAVLGVGATFGLGHAAPLFVSLLDSGGPIAWIVPFALVGLPAFLMGGTLPVLVRAVEPDEAHVGGATGRLYAWNTAGAIIGVLATPFLLAPAFGFRGAALLAALANLLVAAVAFAAGRRHEGHIASPRPASGMGGRKLALGLYAVAGGLALGYEVVWTQLLVQFLSTRAFAFAIVLATYLAGLAIGSALYARVADRSRNPWVVFGVLIAAAGGSAMLIVGLTGPWVSELQSAAASAALSVTGSEAWARSARFISAAAVVVLLPTIFLGAAFPAAVRLTSRAERIGRGVGAVAAWNTAGGIAGTFLVGFLLVPALGIVRTLWLLTSLAAAVGLVAVARGTMRRRRWLAVAATAATAIVLSGWTVPHDKLARLLAEARGGTLEYYDEGAGGTVAVLAQEASAGTFRRLYISGVSNSGDTLPSIRYMRLQALLPLVIHRDEPRSALVIALGTGITCGALLADSGLEERVCVELLPEVVDAAGLFDGNFEVTRDPTVDIRVADGRQELLRDPARYDLITLEPPPPSASGVANLYSREFYELAAERLASGGLLAQWWPLATQNDEDSRSIVRTMLDVFPHVTLWTTELHEMLLVGSMEPIVLDAGRIARRAGQPTIRAALGEVGVGSPAALLATWVTGREGLERYAGEAPPVTDDHPVIEYGGWVRADEIVRVLPRIAELASDVPLRGANPTLVQAIASEKHRLWTFYGAGLAAYAGDRDGWATAMGRVVADDPDNPYYGWFLGGGGARSEPTR